MFHALYGLPVINLRTFMTYGPGQRDGSKLIPYVATALLRGESPRLSSGTREVDWIYVGDVVDAYLAAAVADGVEGTSIDIGSGGRSELGCDCEFGLESDAFSLGLLSLRALLLEPGGQLGLSPTHGQGMDRLLGHAEQLRRPLQLTLHPPAPWE